MHFTLARLMRSIDSDALRTAASSSRPLPARPTGLSPDEKRGHMSSTVRHLAHRGPPPQTARYLPCRQSPLPAQGAPPPLPPLPRNKGLNVRFQGSRFDRFGPIPVGYGRL